MKRVKYVALAAMVCMLNVGCVLEQALMNPAEGQAILREVVVNGISWVTFIADQAEQLVGVLPA